MHKFVFWQAGHTISGLRAEMMKSDRQSIKVKAMAKMKMLKNFMKIFLFVNISIAVLCSLFFVINMTSLKNESSAHAYGNYFAHLVLQTCVSMVIQHLLMAGMFSLLWKGVQEDKKRRSLIRGA